jgi:hypothetical protein
MKCEHFFGTRGGEQLSSRTQRESNVRHVVRRDFVIHPRVP